MAIEIGMPPSYVEVEELDVSYGLIFYIIVRNTGASSATVTLTAYKDDTQLGSTSVTVNAGDYTVASLKIDCSKLELGENNIVIVASSDSTEAQVPVTINVVSFAGG